MVSICVSKDDCSGLGAAYKNACTPQCVCCVRPECVLCGVCSMCALRVHVRTHVCQGTPFSVCLMSMSAHVSRRVCTWALMACVHVLMCLPGPHAHITVPGGDQCSDLTHKTGFPSSQTWGQELG